MKMTESTDQVYDLTYPSPVTLKEISAIAIVAELWREEIARAEIKSLDELHLVKDNILLKSVTLNIPSTIYDILVEYVAKFRVSIADWIKYHSKDVLFDTDYNSHIEQLLNNFHDFVWDWNGAIHYVRTAKRMMLCDQFTAVEKFKIACWYCFEDDIEQIWPFASLDINLAQIDFYDRPLPYYWICCLRNELHNLPNPEDEPIDEVMFNYHLSQDFFAREYFWNRIPHERRSQPTVMMSSSFHSSLFARFTLPRLNDFELEEFLAENGVNFMYSLLNFAIEKVHVLPAWMYIRNKLNRSQFILLIEKLLEAETRVLTAKERMNSNDVYLCCEIWKNSPENLKQCVLNDVLLNETLFKSPRMRSSDTKPREMRFLITVLLEATFEQRHKFWCKNWRNLINGARVKDLLAVMKLCFRNENDVSLFKEQHMSKYENIGPYCVELLRLCYFKELRVLLSFCCSDEQKLRELKQQLLRSNFLGENSILSYTICRSYKELNALVEDAFEDVGLRVEFKNQFVSSPVTEHYFCDYIDSGEFDRLIQFVETFAPEEAVHVLKQRLLDFFNEHLVSGVIYEMKGDKLQKFLVWLLDSEDEISKFKQSLKVDDIFCNVIQNECDEFSDEESDGSDDGYMRYVPYPDRLDNFINWYFNNNAEEIRKIKERFSDRLEVFGPSRSRK
ncbi:uncharacterized protein LOC135838588 [Planococcus citri]|uniref:uncharacterized protein LOC135838588 n=1 Tax=Planococcus citri TaxID=170843 RepID=UPI0031F7340C